MRRISKKLPGPLVVVVIAIHPLGCPGLASEGCGGGGRGTGRVTPFNNSGSCLRADPFVLPAAIALTILIYADEVLTAAGIRWPTRPKDRCQPGIRRHRYGQYWRRFPHRVSSGTSASRTAGKRSDGWQITVGKSVRRRPHHHFLVFSNPSVGTPAHRGLRRESSSLLHWVG